MHTRELLFPLRSGASARAPILLWLNLAESNPPVSLSGDNRPGFVVCVCPLHPRPCMDSPALKEKVGLCVLVFQSLFLHLASCVFPLCLRGRSPEEGNPYSSLYFI